MKISLPSTYPVTCHTNYIGAGSTFIAIKGQKEDGIDYIPSAIEKGASTIIIANDALLSSEVKDLIEKKNIALHRVENTRAALAELSAQALDYPANDLKIIGITGTKGKTTSAWLLFHVLKKAGYKTALLSTVKNFIQDEEFDTHLTTQQPDYLHAFFNVCKNEGIEYVVMEVAAQAISLHRVETLAFDGIIFTNFDQEHAEFYPHLNDYFLAKRKFFLEYRKENAPCILNQDNQWCAQLLDAATLTFGRQENASVHIKNIESNQNGLSFSIIHQKQEFSFSCPQLIGDFNAENCAAVIAMAFALQIPISTIQSALQTFGAIPGRLARYQMPKEIICFIDYAHNPSSFQAVLPLLKSLTNQLIVVFGCGGDRDRTKRPLMGAIAAQLADQVIITTDNPRSESASSICQEIYAGIDQDLKNKASIELDREKAIYLAYNSAKSGAIIALLGKGPDEYQQLGDLKYPFSEAQIIKSFCD